MNRLQIKIYRPGFLLQHGNRYQNGKRLTISESRLLLFAKTDMSNEDLEACFKLVQDVARKAGEVILFVHHRLFFMHPAFSR